MTVLSSHDKCRCIIIHYGISWFTVPFHVSCLEYWREIKNGCEVEEPVDVGV